MVVNFTPNIGLAKPSESELAENWASLTQLADDNNVIIEDVTDVNLISYTPTMIGSTTNPNVGAGSLLGEYCVVQGYVWGNFVIRFLDPGISSGSGAGGYGISLPLPADTTFHFSEATLTDQPGFAACIGEGHYVDSSAVTNCGEFAIDLTTFGGVSYARIVTETYLAKTSRMFIPGDPFSFADNDRITGQFFYKKA